MASGIDGLIASKRTTGIMACFASQVDVLVHLDLTDLKMIVELPNSAGQEFNLLTGQTCGACVSPLPLSL